MSIEYVNDISKIAPASTKLPENSMIVGYQLPLTKGVRLCRHQPRVGIAIRGSQDTQPQFQSRNSGIRRSSIPGFRNLKSL